MCKGTTRRHRQDTNTSKLSLDDTEVVAALYNNFTEEMANKVDGTFLKRKKFLIVEVNEKCSDGNAVQRSAFVQSNCQWEWECRSCK